MQIYHSLAELKRSLPFAVTIGTFDGMHIGHQKVLEHLKKLSSDHLVITFSNHPASILSDAPPPQLLTLSHKLKLLEKQGINNVLVLPFTSDFAKQSAEEFLKTLYSYCPISHLVLGYDAVIGHQRSGTPEILQKLSEQMHFNLVYIPAEIFEGHPISSTRIRACVREKKWRLVQCLLGRHFSFFLTVNDPSKIHLPKQLCLPPSGLYDCVFEIDGNQIPGTIELSADAVSIHPLRSFKGKEIEVFL